MKSRQPGALIGGLGLLIIGGIIATSAAGVPIGGLDRLWPGIVFALGLALLAQFGARSRPANGLLLIGVVLALSSTFLCAFTLQIGNLTWADMIGYWPVFLVIIGMGFLVVYLAEDMREQALLIPSMAIGGLGVAFLPFTLGVIHGAVFTQVVRLSPLLLILIVLAVILRLRSRGRGEAGGSE
jgi:hypothetical protein